MILSLWGNAAFAIKPVKVYEASIANDEGLYGYVGNTVDSVCQPLSVDPLFLQRQSFYQNYTIFYKSDLSNSSEKPLDGSHLFGSGECYVFFKAKPDPSYLTDYINYFTRFRYTTYCPNKHKIPTTVNEFIYFDFAIPDDIDANGDCIEQCPAPTLSTRQTGKDSGCYLLSLTPAPDQTEPTPQGSEGANGKSTYDLIAKLLSYGKPKSNVVLNFRLLVVPGSGKLPLLPEGRPNGQLNIIGGSNTSSKDVGTGTTDANGEVKITFTAPIFSGTHRLIVSCPSCDEFGRNEFKDINVKVPGLSMFPPDIRVPARWAFVGTDNYHYQERFYLTDTAIINLKKLIDRMQLVKSDKTKKPWGVVELNDASLPGGGRYNGYAPRNPKPYNWKATIKNGFHAGHRLGVEIDIRTVDKINTFNDSAHVTKAYNEICKDPNITAKILNHYKKDPHFHAYLLGNVGANLGGGACRKIPT